MYVKNYIRQRKCTHANLKKTTLNMNKEKAKYGSRYCTYVLYSEFFVGAKEMARHPKTQSNKK